MSINSKQKITTTPWLDTKSAAQYLSFNPHTLKIWRCRGDGPRYHVVAGRYIRYSKEALDDYVRGAPKAVS